MSGKYGHMVLTVLLFTLLIGVAAASPEIVDYSVEHVDGTEPDMDAIYVDIEQQDPYVQRVMLRTEHTTEIDIESEGPDDYMETGRDLVAAGADSSTTFEIEVVFDEYVPRFIVGSADQMDWERDYRDDGTVKATVEATPLETPMMLGTQELHDWPEGEDDRADYTLEGRVSFIVSNAERQTGRFFKDRINGTVVGSDGTTGTPDLRRDDMDNEQLVVPVAGPHYDFDGSRYGDGVYYAILPENTLELWNVTEPDDLEAWYQGNETSFTATELDDGRMKIEMNPSYSMVELAIGTEWVELTLWQELIWRAWNEARGIFIAGIVTLLGILAGIGIGVRRRRS